MAKLGFLGLGIMGGPMARHLVSGGHNVAVWSHNQEKAKSWQIPQARCSVPRRPRLRRTVDALFSVSVIQPCPVR